ncbi:antitoxin [Salmonella enterica]|nr:antitoxin [Salmonella enterica]
MSLTRLRQQGGAVVIITPSDVTALMGWDVGTQLDVMAPGDSVNIRPAGRVARGRESLAELLEGIDQREIAEFN